MGLFFLRFLIGSVVFGGSRSSDGGIDVAGIARIRKELRILLLIYESIQVSNVFTAAELLS